MTEQGGGTILVVEPDDEIRAALEAQLSAIGYTVEASSDFTIAGGLFEQSMPDLALVDLVVDSAAGFQFLESARALLPTSSLIAIVPENSTDATVLAMKRGADHCLTRPIRPDALTVIVERALEKPGHAKRAAYAETRAIGTLANAQLDPIVGGHPTMQRLFNRLLQAAKSRSTVLIEGETGTGKEMVARALHENSLRRDGPLIRLNCAALAESILESELFGHERGAFTGATTRRQGRLEQADQGTLFLDELSEMPLSVQVKLLRFLQERELERVGGNETIPVNARVVAATNRDLRSLVDDGAFREDLYFRLKVVVLQVPPLRGRHSDIPLLADHFLRHYVTENEKEVLGFTPAAREALLAYPWPGNVRELQHAVEQAVVLCEGDLIDVTDLPIDPAGRETESLSLLVPGVTLAEVERYTIMKTLEAVGGSPTKAAAILGVSKRTIHYRLDEWGIRKRSKNSDS